MPEVADHVWKKRPLLLHEVPLPPGGGFTHDILDAERKKNALIDHLALQEECLRETLQINERVKADPSHADVVIAACERDIEFFIDHFIWVHEPRKNEDRRLIAYDFQRLKIIRPYAKHRDTEAPARSTQMKAKSRDLGATQIELACRAHSFLFKNGWSILLGGVTQKDVDDGGILATHQSLFGKFRFMLRHLPKWMRDRLLGPKWDTKDYTKKLIQLNPMKPTNMVEGAQVSEMFGRGGRVSEVFVDEFAYGTAQKQAEKAIKQMTNRICGVSTPAGRGNLFEQLMFTTELQVTQYWMWWPEHPEKDLYWYNVERDNMEDADIASELDLSFDESVGDRCLPDVHIPEFFVKRKSGESADINDRDSLWEPMLPTRVVIDFGASAPMAAVFLQWHDRATPTPFGIYTDFVQVQGKSVDWIVPFITGEILTHTWRGDRWPHVYTPIEKEIIARHARWGNNFEVYGDWQGSTQNVVTGAHTAFDELEKYGIRVTKVKVLDDYNSIMAARQLMRFMRAEYRLATQRNGDQKTCPTFAEVVTQWRFPKPLPGMTTKSLTPVHDRFCHGGDCIKMAALTIDIPDSDTIVSAAAGKVIGKRGSDLVRGRYSGGVHGR